MKCSRPVCKNEGKYQPLIRIKASILPANGNDVLAVIRLPFTVCMRCRLRTTNAEILAVVPPSKMKAVIEEARRRTGAAPNPDRTDVHWVRITGEANHAKR